jgi:hypothetical protein
MNKRILILMAMIFASVSTQVAAKSGGIKVDSSMQDTNFPGKCMEQKKEDNSITAEGGGIWWNQANSDNQRQGEVERAVLVQYDNGDAVCLYDVWFMQCPEPDDNYFYSASDWLVECDGAACTGSDALGYYLGLNDGGINRATLLAENSCSASTPTVGNDSYYSGNSNRKNKPDK